MSLCVLSMMFQIFLYRGCKGRSVWFFAHWLLGTSVCLLGILNIYTGLQAYHEKTSRSIHLWTIIFTIQLSFMAFIYLLQDKWVYMQKQGVILGNEPVRSTDKEISTRNKLKVLTTETCWKSIWITNDFFQLTWDSCHSSSLLYFLLSW